jgi:glycosyltransferase involved in cell wall biosynthesis
MKVVVVHNLVEGGAWRRLSSQLAHLGCDIVEVTLSTGKPITPDATVVPLKMRAPDSRRWLRPILRYADFVSLVAAYRAASAIVRHERPDAIWLNPCQYLQAPMVRRLSSVPTIYYCDEPRRADYDPVVMLDRPRSTRWLYAPLRWLERKADRSTVATAHQLVTNSQFTREGIRRAYGRTAKIVRCGTSGFFRPSGVNETPKINAPILSVGALIPSKGHDLVIRAAAVARLNRPVIIVAPRSPSVHERQRLSDLATAVGVEIDIKIAITDENLRELYRGAYVTMYLAHDEPFGLVSVEAQASGCPVIVADEGGLPETLELGVTGWAVPRVAECAAELLVKLGDSALRTEMALAAADHGARYTWEDSARMMRAVLEEAIT